HCHPDLSIARRVPADVSWTSQVGAAPRDSWVAPGGSSGRTMQFDDRARGDTAAEPLLLLHGCSEQGRSTTRSRRSGQPPPATFRASIGVTSPPADDPRATDPSTGP